MNEACGKALQVTTWQDERMSSPYVNLWVGSGVDNDVSGWNSFRIYTGEYHKLDYDGTGGGQRETSPSVGLRLWNVGQNRDVIPCPGHKNGDSLIPPDRINACAIPASMTPGGSNFLNDYLPTRSSWEFIELR